MKNLLFACSLCFIALNGFSQNIGYDETSPGSKISIHENLSVGASYSSLAAPTSGAIIQGLVGIGTSSPTDQCQVNDGSIGISNDNNTAGSLKFYEPSTSGSNYMSFKAGAMAANVTYTLPTADGTSGQMLSTNGSGTLSWATASGGSGSGWGLSGNSIASGNFIGTTNSQALLFKVNSTQAGYLGASDNNTFFGNSCVYTSGTSNVGIGYKATVYGTISNSIAIGASSQVQPGSTSSDDIAIGDAANVTGGGASSYSTAIGSAAQVQASYSLAIGRSANVNSNYAIAIGDAAQAQGANSLVIGQSAYTNQTNTVAIGTSTQAEGATSVAVGAGAYTSTTNSIAIGGGSSTNITQAEGNYSMSIGYRAFSNSTDAIAIGDFAQAQGTSTIVIGNNLYDGNANTAAIGNSSNTSVFLNGATNTAYALQVGTSSSNGNGAYLTKGGTWTNASDRNLKENFSAVNGAEVLAKLCSLDITRWNYKGTDEYHIGPMAQDFFALFNLGGDDKRISTIDPAGVAIVAIKELNQKIEEQQKTIDALISEVKKLSNK